jgi:hypothetical protein
MPARSPLTAAARQRSRRPARHVVCPLANFSPTAFLKLLKLLLPKVIGVRQQFQPKISMKAGQAGAFFSSESGEKKRTGRVGLSVSLIGKHVVNSRTPTLPHGDNTR